MSANRSVTASFTKNNYTLTIIRTGAGTVTSNPAGIYFGAACSATFTAGTVVTLSEVADPSYTFAGWSGYASVQVLLLLLLWMLIKLFMQVLFKVLVH